MRVTGGKYRGRTVVCPPGVIRPAMDRMRESLFSILGNLDDSSFLDLFSGSGCVGIEAASRGAEPVHIVEKDRGKRKVILSNISMVETKITLFMSDVYRFIPSAKRTYDIVYADPPFPMDGKVKLAQAVADAGIVEKGGLFIIHYPSEERSTWPEEIGDLKFIDERKYGRSLLRFYRRESDPVSEDISEE
ncbi:MAG: 16S rRNA (guanine(966)-N(2))-methyltransferase RsmD [Sphaerochaeta sp.]|jgi:16S rRNA (guanine(966)-N(2))-methyltransferase RsmD